MSMDKKAEEKKKVNLEGIDTKKEEDFSEWYTQMITKADMIEYYDVSGCYIFRPNSFQIWENIQNYMNKFLMKDGVKNCYFPMFVSQAALEKEKEHVEGFAPEVAWVTRSGQSDLLKPVAVRPTSETIMYPAFAKWIRSHRDLPLRLNQWCNIVRWEFKHPVPFIRTREFLWQEGHTAFANKPEAEAEVLKILDLYKDTYENLLCVPVIQGRKTEVEKFAGGDYTTTVEAFIPANGRAVQAATSHHLGQNFSKMFGIQFESDEQKGEEKKKTQEEIMKEKKEKKAKMLAEKQKKKEMKAAGIVEPEKSAEEEKPKEEEAPATLLDEGKQFVYQNSWGFTTRSIGIMAMVHGDNKGLILPPKVAPLQVIIVPIYFKGKDEEAVEKSAKEVVEILAKVGVSAEVDDGDQRPGWKFNHWELRGIPIRIEIGPKDVENKKIVAVRRDNGEKCEIMVEKLESEIPALINKMQSDMLAKAKAERDSRISKITTWDQFMNELNDKKNICLSPFCLNGECEENCKARSAKESKVLQADLTSSAKSLCIPFEQPELPEGTKCFCCGEPAKKWVLFGRSY